MSKYVRFYELRIEDANEDRKDVTPTFWTKLFQEGGSWLPEDRTVSLNGVDYVGEFKTSGRTQYVVVSRIRDTSERLDELDLDEGRTKPLQLDGLRKRVSEPTYIVPFGNGGQRNRAAIFTPAVRGTRYTTLGGWFTFVCDLVSKGEGLVFDPIIDQKAFDRLTASKGATKLEVRVPKSRSTSASSSEKNSVVDALVQASEITPDTMDLTLTWSLGHGGGSQSDKKDIQAAALWVQKAGVSDRALVNLLEEQEDGSLKVEHMSLFAERMTETVQFDVQSGQAVPEEVVLKEINDAIRSFQKRFID